jgi:hypothetical protein
MGTIAKWLACAQAAGTPEVGFACFDLDTKGRISCSLGFIHAISPRDGAGFKRMFAAPLGRLLDICFQ